MKTSFLTLRNLTVIPLLALPLAAHGQANYAIPYTFTTLAGNAGYGSADGLGSAARFNSPRGVAVDSAGSVYVADAQNRTLRKVTPTDMVTTLARGFYLPSGVAVDSSGNAYVADGNHTIRKVTPAGVVTTLAGAGQPGSADGTGSAAQFNSPRGVAVDTNGTVYVADTWNDTIRKVTPAGVVTTLAGSSGQQGSADGTGSAARFYGPSGVALDSAGNLYVADTYNNKLRKVTPAGVVTTLAAGFYFPNGVAVDGLGSIYVADTFNNTVRKVTPAGVVTTLAGGTLGSLDGTGSAAQFNGPSGVAVDTNGTVYVADSANNTIRRVTSAGVVTTLAGLAGSPGSADGTGSAARFSKPSAVAVDREGDVFVADTFNHTIRKITPAGMVTTLAGLAGSPGSADGMGSEARFNFQGPFGLSAGGVAVDIAGNVFVADTGNDTIRKVTPAGDVTTLAGLAGSPGTSDGAGSAARFWYPRGVAVDGAGNAYVADTWAAMIRKVTPAGLVTTLAGLANQGGDNDGTGSAARFMFPTGLAVDGAGNVYVADGAGPSGGNNTIRIVTPAGVVTTLAGLSGRSGSEDGTGSAARFHGPFGVTVDSTGSVYVADELNNTIRKGTPPLMILDFGLGFGVNGGQFGFNLTGRAGQGVVIEASTDLMTWSPLWTNTIGAGALSFSDPQSAAFSNRFYRARTP